MVVQECNTKKLEELLRCDMYPCCIIHWYDDRIRYSHLEIGCATHGIPAPTEGACGMQTFFPANKAFLDIFSSKNMLFLGSTLCVMSMMVNSTKILIMLMDD